LLQFALRQFLPDVRFVDGSAGLAAVVRAHGPQGLSVYQ
jgi:hypothetical protein